MAIRLPEKGIISDVIINHNIPNFKTQSMSLIEKTKARGLHRLEGSVNFTVGDDIQAQKELTAFIINTQGSLNEFELDLPRHYKSENLTTNPIVNTDYGIGTNQLNLTGFTETIYAGSCFTIPNDTKIYFVKNNVNPGEVATIFPALRQRLLANSVIEFINPVIMVRFSEDIQSISNDESGFILTTSIDFKEAL